MANPKNSVNDIYLKEAKRIAPELKDKTLYIAQSDIDEDLTVEKISKIYPYPFKVASFEEMEQMIAAKDSNKAFATVVTMDLGQGNVNCFFISGAEDGRVYLFEYPGVSFTKVAMIDIKTNQRIKEKHLKKFASAVKE